MPARLFVTRHVKSVGLLCKDLIGTNYLKDTVRAHSLRRISRFVSMSLYCTCGRVGPRGILELWVAVARKEH